MLSEKIEEYINYEMIYKPEKNNLHIINEENIILEMIYYPNENKKEKLKLFQLLDIFIFDDEKEFSEDILRILGKYFVKNNKNKS